MQKANERKRKKERSRSRGGEKKKEREEEEAKRMCAEDQAVWEFLKDRPEKKNGFTKRQRRSGGEEEKEDLQEKQEKEKDLGRRSSAYDKTRRRASPLLSYRTISYPY